MAISRPESATPASTAPAPTVATRRAPAALLSRFALGIGFVAMVIFFTVKTPLFLTPGNIMNIAVSSTVLLVIAVPTALLVIMGHVDLSVGSTVGLAGVTTGLLINGGTPWPVAAVAGIAVGALIGVFNGALVAVTNLSPIIVTLGMLQLVRGLAELVATNPPNGFGPGMAALGRGYWLGMPLLVWIALAVFVLGMLFLYLTPAGRHTYAIGVNKEAAFLSGIRTTRLPLTLFLTTGAAAGLGGVLLAARLDSAPPSTLGVNFELQVLTAVLLGGVAFTGGRGTIAGALLGVAFLGVLQNGLVLLNASNSVQQIATGTALVVAAGLDEFGLRQGRVRALLRGRS